MTITAKIIADSISEQGVRITTLELEYPRYIHSQFMTHRQFSRNAQSSRAIPTAKQIELIRDLPAPNFAQNKAGMQAGELLGKSAQSTAKFTWQITKDRSLNGALSLLDLGVHKQWANRLLEPFSTIKVVVTATEWDNFFKLRLHHDAQPEIQELAQAMKTAMDSSKPEFLNDDEWHLPYIDKKHQDVLDFDIKERCLISAARCARVSYLNHDNTNPDIEKDFELAKKLLDDGHLSPFEHQAKPMNQLNAETIEDFFWESGITHTDKNKIFWSNNFRGWIQHRALLQ